MVDRIVLHIDMDAFFPSIEQRENLRFQGLPVVVGADPKQGSGRGVVSSASYEARKYGIHSALPISRAYQLCPTAIFLPVNMPLYAKVSDRIMEIIKKYSPQWEIVSLDEAFLDMSFSGTYEETPSLAKKLKQEIFDKERLTATVGIGPNKLIAKMVSEKAKPDGLLAIKPEQVRTFLEPLDIDDLPGIGEKTSEKLRSIGISKIKELKKLSKAKLKEMFGKWGEGIYDRSRGIDEAPVSSEEVVKSIGKEHTFEKDTRDPEIIFGIFDKIIKSVWQELTENEFTFKTITVVCRFQGFETHTKSKTLNPALASKSGAKEKTDNLEILTKEAKRLLLKFLLENKKPLRLIGLRVKI
ncbi:MAG: DNA polymerase IV [Parcubacteria group bacterium Gr01-1014_30]|nr:MAG: DNA polymerase IV [Parcubacteria group bacterium Gr01-1014_30]